MDREATSVGMLGICRRIYVSSITGNIFFIHIVGTVLMEIDIYVGSIVGMNREV
jgi:hypothetical protein